MTAVRARGDRVASRGANTVDVCMLFRDFDSRIISQAKILCGRGFGVRLIGPDSVGYGLARSMLPKCTRNDVIPFRGPPVPIVDLRLQLAQLVKALGSSCEVYHCHGMNEILCGLALKALRRFVIYDVGDDVPSIIATMVGRMIGSQALGKCLESILRSFEVICCGKFDRIVALTDTLAKDRSRYNDRTFTIGYYPDPSYNPSNVDGFLLEKYKRYNVVIYDGTMIPEKGIYTMLEVSDLVRREIENYKLLLIGGFGQYRERAKRSFLHRISELGLEENVELLGWVPYDQVPRYINLGKLGLCLLVPWCYSYLVTEPYKVFEVMACGKPVVVAQDNLPARLLVEESGGGILVNQADVRGTADCIMRLIRDDPARQKLGNNARKFIEDRRNLQHFEQKLLSLYQQTPIA